MLDVLHVICIRLRPGHLSKRVGFSEEIVKKSRTAPLNAIIIIIIIMLQILPWMPFTETKTKVNTKSIVKVAAANIQEEW